MEDYQDKGLLKKSLFLEKTDAVIKGLSEIRLLGIAWHRTPDFTLWCCCCEVTPLHLVKNFCKYDCSACMDQIAHAGADMGSGKGLLRQ